MMKSGTRVSADLAFPHGAKVKENEEVPGIIMEIRSIIMQQLCFA
jgi:hypothetical protein